MMSQPQLHTITMEGISIEFPGVKALSDVNFQLRSGTIHALVGANGAGKSTLMKVLSGAYNHYSGKIYVDGREVDIRTPRAAKKLGIQTVYQEVDVALIPNLSVAENIMLDVLVNSMGRKQFVNWSHVHSAAEQVLRRLNIDIDTKALIQDLSLAQKQMVLIARAIAEETRFLILDEPTAPLSHTETEELFRVVQDLAYNHGVGVVFISHRLPEVFAICREITVMRDGTVVANRPIEGLTAHDVVELMLGRKFEENYTKRPVEIGDTLLEVRGLTELNGRVTDVNLTVRSGEIVGVAGLVGAGKSELCKTLFGALPARSGEIWLRGKRLMVTSPHAAVKQGLALVPEERRKEGVLVDESVVTNLTVASLENFCGALGFIRKRAERATARKVIADLKVKTPSAEQKVAYLSGGNQQKVAVGKWLIAEADVYIFDEPTKGVDVGAKREIFALIGQLAAMGKGIIYASCELSEILALTDRTYVMYDGRIVKELRTAETNEQEILYWATGGK